MKSPAGSASFWPRHTRTFAWPGACGPVRNGMPAETNVAGSSSPAIVWPCAVEVAVGAGVVARDAVDVEGQLERDRARRRECRRRWGEPEREGARPERQEVEHDRAVREGERRLGRRRDGAAGAVLGERLLGAVELADGDHRPREREAHAVDRRARELLQADHDLVAVLGELERPHRDRRLAAVAGGRGAAARTSGRAGQGAPAPARRAAAG